MHLHELQQRPRRRARGLDHDTVAGRERGRQLPRRHQQREVERDDLPDDAERLVEVVGDRVLVDLGDPALLGADGAGEVAEMVDRQRKVGIEGLADRLAVLPALRDREHLEVRLDRVGDRVQDLGAVGRRGLAPRLARSVRRVEREVDVRRGRARDLAERLSRRGARIGAVGALDRGDPMATDEVLVARLQRDGALGRSWCGIDGGLHSNGHCAAPSGSSTGRRTANQAAPAPSSARIPRAGVEKLRCRQARTRGTCSQGCRGALSLSHWIRASSRRCQRRPQWTTSSSVGPRPARYCSAAIASVSASRKHRSRGCCKTATWSPRRTSCFRRRGVSADERAGDLPSADRRGATATCAPPARGR